VEKIARKKLKDAEKYRDISVENYGARVTDLVGIRALHLFKGDFPEIHKSVIETWDLVEQATAYVRKGDAEELRELYRKLDLAVDEHSDGYRSIHYIIETRMTKNAVICEFQVRTIFEEGWSEIDHKIRYPSFSDEALIRDFLHIFNRLSGAADEMGTFAKRLADDFSSNTKARRDAEIRADEIARELTEKVEKLTATSTKNSSMQAEIAELKGLIQRQKTDALQNRGIFPELRMSDLKNLVGAANSLEQLHISPAAFKDAVEASRRIRELTVASPSLREKPQSTD
jgi:ppGpp synthetase/RelA/SpoT-type nucleotidyltranferase